MSDAARYEILSAYLDGELSGEEAARVEAMLAEDNRARQLLDELRAASAAVAAMPHYRVGRDLTESILRRAEKEILAGKSAPVAASSAGVGRPRVENGRPISIAAKESSLNTVLPESPRAGLPLGRSPRAWIWAAATVAAALLIVAFYRPAEDDRELAKVPAAKPGNMGGAAMRAAPSNRDEMLAIREKDVDDAAELAASSARPSAAAGERGDQFGDPKDRVAAKEFHSLGGPGKGIAGVSAREEFALPVPAESFADESAEALIVVEVDVASPRAIDEDFGTLLAQNDIRFPDRWTYDERRERKASAKNARELAKDAEIEKRQSSAVTEDAVFVEAERGQIEAAIAALRARPERFQNVRVAQAAQPALERFTQGRELDQSAAPNDLADGKIESDAQLLKKDSLLREQPQPGRAERQHFSADKSRDFGYARRLSPAEYAGPNLAAPAWDRADEASGGGTFGSPELSRGGIEGNREGQEGGVLAPQSPQTSRRNADGDAPDGEQTSPPAAAAIRAPFGTEKASPDAATEALESDRSLSPAQASPSPRVRVLFLFRVQEDERAGDR